MSKMDEQILVVKRSNLFGTYDEYVFQGTVTTPSLVQRLMNYMSANIQVKRRGDAENDPTYKQPIPYCVIRRGDEIFVYKRLSGGGEARLHDKLSVGVGGHMNQLGLKLFEYELAMNLTRELDEELIIDSRYDEFKTIGLINDDSDEVGKVHIGVLVVLDLRVGTNVSVRETDQLAGEWMTIEKLKSPETYSQLENWSKIAVDALEVI